jgi:hypothetical protein
VTSTCYALHTLALSGKVYDEQIENSEGSSSSASNNNDNDNNNKVRIRKATKALIRSSWREDDLFQVPLVLYTLLGVDPSFALTSSGTDDDDPSRRIKRLISAVLKARPHRRAGVRQENSEYTIYQICKVSALLHDASEKGQLPSQILPDDAESEIFWTILCCAEVSSNELCRQLAYRTAGDSTSFDVIRLAYSLLA